MLNDLLDDNGQPLPMFHKIVRGMTEDVLKHPPQTFLVPIVETRDGKISYWGLIDPRDTPDEDWQLELNRRFYSACKLLDQKQIKAFHLCDINGVLAGQFRKPIMRKMTDDSEPTLT